MSRGGTGIRIVAVLLTLLGFATMVTGLEPYITRLDVPGDQGNQGVARFVLGIAVLAFGLALLDRGFGRGARRPRLRIERVPITHPDALLLVEAVQEEYVARYGGRDDTPIAPDDFADARGAFFVGYLGDDPVATGAWRIRHDVEAFGTTRTGEVKRMYVVPSAQRQGHARRMLEHLEESLSAAGVQAAVLETGTRQPEAMALYEACGYALIDNFGHYRDSPTSRCFGKPL